MYSNPSTFAFQILGSQALLPHLTLSLFFSFFLHITPIGHSASYQVFQAHYDS